MLIFVGVTTALAAVFSSFLGLDASDVLSNPEKYRKLFILIIFTWFVILFVFVPFTGYMFNLKSFRHGNYPFLIFRELPFVYKINLLLVLFEIFIVACMVIIGSEYFQYVLIFSAVHLILIYNFYKRMRKRQFGVK